MPLLAQKMKQAGERIQETGERTEDNLKHTGPGHTEQGLQQNVESKGQQMKEGMQHATEQVRSHLPGFKGGTGGEKHQST